MPNLLRNIIVGYEVIIFIIPAQAPGRNNIIFTILLLNKRFVFAPFTVFKQDLLI
jgi:hypothetical protein